MNDRYPVYKTAHVDDPEIVYIFYTHDIHRLEKCLKNTGIISIEIKKNAIKLKKS